MKLCKKCGTNKSTSEFAKSSHFKDGFQNYCRQCSTANRAVRRAALTDRSAEEILNARHRLHPDGVKTCRTCRKSKPLDEFHGDKRNVDGLAEMCKLCKIKRAAESQSGRRALIVDTLSWIFGPACLKCGSLDDIEIDHVNPVLLGGENSLINYQLLCGHCNANKGGTYADYRPDFILVS